MYNNHIKILKSEVYMRVITGTAKGRRLFCPDGDDIRPTSDRIKESIFNILAEYLHDCNFLDLFCGVGSIGIEAVSRGANSCVFVDNSEVALKYVLKNVNHTNISEKCTTLKNDVSSAISYLSRNNSKFDIIFLDPPYKYNLNEKFTENNKKNSYSDILINKTLISIFSSEILKDDGIVIVEHSAKINIQPGEKFSILRHKNYGKITSVTFLH